MTTATPAETPRSSPGRKTFLRWAAGQAALVGLAIAALLAVLAVRMHSRKPHFFSSREPWRIWVPNPPSGANANGRVSGVALEPGGELHPVEGWIYTNTQNWQGKNYAWQLMHFSWYDEHGLVGANHRWRAQFLVCGATVVKDGVTWREAWAGDDVAPDGQSSDAGVAGAWSLEGEGVPAAVTLRKDETHDIGQGARWGAYDGLLVIKWQPTEADRRNMKGAQWYGEERITGRLSADGRSFEGVDRLCRPVKGTKLR
jgi:hypothetical protein